MAKTKPKKDKQEEPLRWRVTPMSLWRDKARYTLEEASAALEEPPYRIKITHNSLGRYENGKQMPKIEVLEALATLYGTDLWSLLNREPTFSLKESPPATAQDLAAIWDAIDSQGRQLLAGVAHKVVKAAG